MRTGATMISKRNAHKVYGSDSRVIRKGEPGWVSDHPERRGESYGTNPLSRMDQHIRRSSRVPVEPIMDPDTFSVGTTYLTNNEADSFEWRVVERDGRRYWRLVATHRNGAR